MDINYLLSRKGIDTKSMRTLAMRHVPKEPGLRKALPWLAAEEPDLFNAYQQGQGKIGKQLAHAAYLASFIGQDAGEATFAGLYKVAGHQPISYKEFWKIPANGELRKLGMRVASEPDFPPSSLWFDLQLTDIYAEWKGKLVVGWPPPEISWTRWADRNEFPVKAILDESRFVRAMPRWNEIVLTWDELRHLPRSWVQALSEWRGIYFILDGADGKGYVGSASGEENLYGRWSNYAASGHGGNKLLRERVPDKFIFSILELVSPTESEKEVVVRESNWKDRLHTREFGLNAN